MKTIKTIKNFTYLDLKELLDSIPDEELVGHLVQNLENNLDKVTQILYNSLVMKELKEKLDKLATYERGSILMDGKKWGVGYKEKWDCYFIQERGTPNVFYLFEEELNELQSMVKEGAATFDLTD